MSPETLPPPDGILSKTFTTQLCFLDVSTDVGCHGETCGTNNARDRAGQLMDFLPVRWGIPPHRGSRTMPHGAVDDTRYYREEIFDDDRFYEDAPGA